MNESHMSKTSCTTEAENAKCQHYRRAKIGYWQSQHTREGFL